MKKYSLIAICAILLFAAGCGKKNQVKCSGKMTEGGMTLKAEIIADLDKNDKISDATVVYELDNKDAAKQYCSIFKLMETSDSGVSVSCSEKKVTIKGLANFNSDDGETIVGMSKKDFIKQMEQEEKISCK